MKLVIADASCLITLDKIDEIELLRRLYEQVVVTPEVADEVGDSLPDWVNQQTSSNKVLINQLTAELEIGEASSIALAFEIRDCLLIIDEKKGRRKARELGLRIKGTFGVLIEALDLGYVEDVDSLVERLRHVGFRISNSLLDEMRSKIH